MVKFLKRIKFAFKLFLFILDNRIEILTTITKTRSIIRYTILALENNMTEIEKEQLKNLWEEQLNEIEEAIKGAKL